MIRRYAQRALTISKSAQSLFIAITVGVNLVVLGRSYVTMLVLDFGSLGLVALLQSIILLVGTLQFGFHQGGYRLLCSADGDEAKSINNLVYSYTVLIGLGAMAVALVAFPFTDSTLVGWFAVLGAFGGAVTLLRNWLNSQMIALQMLRQLNLINLWSALASLIPLAFIHVDPLAMCVLSVLLQPTIGIVIAMLFYPRLRPTGVDARVTLVKAVLASGFAMFLSSLFLQLNMQLERWYVVSFLGIEALGHLYLAILFVTLFQIVPNALSALYLPRLVRLHDSGEQAELSRLMRQFFLLTTAYSLAGAAALLLLGKPVLALLLPRYVPDLPYAQLLLPGLVVFTMVNSLAVVFNILIRYRTYLLSFGAGIAATALLLGSVTVTGYRFDLTQVSWIKSGVYLLMAFLLFAGYLAITRAWPGFRFAILPRVKTGAAA